MRFKSLLDIQTAIADEKGKFNARLLELQGKIYIEELSKQSKEDNRVDVNINVTYDDAEYSDEDLEEYAPDID